MKKYLLPAQGGYLFLSWKHLRTLFVWKFVSLFLSSSQSWLPSNLCSEAKLPPKFHLRILWVLRKWKSMILSEHTLKENDVKLIVIEFLSTLESATSWLDIHECYVWGWSCKLDASARDSLIFSTSQLVSYSFTCHVTCKVKYFGKVANFFEGKTKFFHVFCSTVVPWTKPVVSAVDHCGSQTQSMKSCHKETIICFKEP